ncbi:hypothetical protein [Desulfovirgula thermocuniculi]|uniref:hypothetical protein n=1 Tax=Desulfovirgula thermocuniculi TaxID=348842 RepID=UPI00041A57BB|nr:hypothetical protein [Desulfovirgula thermocuniculi]
MSAKIKGLFPTPVEQEVQSKPESVAQEGQGKFELMVVEGEGHRSLEELIRTNFGDAESVSLFTRVKFPLGGATKFRLPREDDPDVMEDVPEIVGVVLDHHRVNAYWPGEFKGTGNPPQCYSPDGLRGVGDPGGPCAACKLNQMGSKGDNRKACKNMWRLYILRSGEFFPVVLSLPPTSIGPFRKFLKTLTGKWLDIHQVVVRIGLKEAVSTSKIPYSKAVFTVVEKLPDEVSARLKRYAQEFRNFREKYLARRDREAAVELGLAEEVAQGDPAFEDFPF